VNNLVNLIVGMLKFWCHRHIFYKYLCIIILDNTILKDK